MTITVKSLSERINIGREKRQNKAFYCCENNTLWGYVDAWK